MSQQTIIPGQVSPVFVNSTGSGDGILPNAVFLDDPTTAITFSFAITEPSDTAAFNVNLSDTLSFAITEAPDTAAFNVSVADQLSFAITEPQDIAAFTIDGNVALSFAITENPDTAAFFLTEGNGQITTGGIWWKPHPEERYDHALDVRETLRQILEPEIVEDDREEVIERVIANTPVQPLEPIDLRPIINQIREQIGQEMRAREAQRLAMEQDDDEAAVMLLLH